MCEHIPIHPYNLFKIHFLLTLGDSRGCACLPSCWCYKPGPPRQQLFRLRVHLLAGPTPPISHSSHHPAGPAPPMRVTLHTILQGPHPPSKSLFTAAYKVRLKTRSHLQPTGQLRAITDYCSPNDNTGSCRSQSLRCKFHPSVRNEGTAIILMSPTR